VEQVEKHFSNIA